MKNKSICSNYKQTVFHFRNIKIMVVSLIILEILINKVAKTILWEEKKGEKVSTSLSSTLNIYLNKYLANFQCIF